MALIAPYRNDRSYCRELISSAGGFIEVHLDAPLRVCQERDPKGLYADAAAGKDNAKDLPGVSFPYEESLSDAAGSRSADICNNEDSLFYREEFDGAEIRIDTSGLSIEEEIEIVLSYLKKEGYLH